jgi:hypothetical protein
VTSTHSQNSSRQSRGQQLHRFWPPADNTKSTYLHCRSHFASIVVPFALNTLSTTAVYYAQAFEAWNSERLANSKDELFCLGLHFAKCVRCGVETLYHKFLPVFLVTGGKKHYFEIGLSSINRLYSSIPFKILQRVRINRTVYHSTVATTVGVNRWQTGRLML